MFKAKVTFAMSLMTFTFSAIIAASASAEMSWFVSGTKLAAVQKVALASTAGVDESATLNFPSISIRITCTGGVNKVLIGSKAE